jgi:hypothetical protein
MVTSWPDGWRLRHLTVPRPNSTQLLTMANPNPASAFAGAGCLRPVAWRENFFRANAPAACNIVQPDFSNTGNLSLSIPTPLFGIALIESITDTTLKNNLAAIAASRLASVAPWWR